MTEHVETRLDRHVLHVTLNRPEKKNALTLAMYDALTDMIAHAESDPEVRVILITGFGDCFTSGNDLKDFLEEPPVGDASAPVRFLRAISGTKIPIVAAVNGLAIGIGTTMLLHCDLVYAADTARFQLPFVNLGLVPEAGSSFILPRMMGHQKAAELLFLGEPFDAATAMKVGITNDVIPADELWERATQAALALASKPPIALQQTKVLLRRGSRAALADSMSEELSHFAACLSSAEAKEAMQAILEKRAPDFGKAPQPSA